MKDYKKQLYSFDLIKITKFSSLLFFVTLIFGAVIKSLFFKSTLFSPTNIWFIVVCFCVLILFVPLHEGLHALGFMLSGAKTKEIKFGFIKQSLMFYCHCSKPMKASIYRFALILPTVLLGVSSYIVSIIYFNCIFLLITSLFLAGSAGDLIMFRETLRLNKSQLILDHSKLPAYYLLYEANNLPLTFTEATEEMENALEIQLSALNKKIKK